MRINGWALAAVAALALAAGGCGGNEAADGGTVAGEPAAEAEAAAADFDELDMCALSEPAEREAALGEPVTAAEPKNGVANRGCEISGSSGKAYLIYLLTEAPGPAPAYFETVRQEAGDGVKDIPGVGEKAFSVADSGSVNVYALSGKYVLNSSIVYFQDSDRPAGTGPLVDGLWVLTGRILERL
jgi:hypothetical protein